MGEHRPPLASPLVPLARKYKGSTTVATSAVQQDVTLNVLNFNRAPSFFNTDTINAITVLVSGAYLVMADIAFTGGTSGYRGCLVLVNGVLVRENGFEPVVESRPSIVAAMLLNANDVVSMATYVTGATPPNIFAANSKDTGLGLVRLGN